jgi:hypothetical protein
MGIPQKTFSLPPSPYDGLADRIKARLAKMSKEEISETFVRSGILTKKGNVTKPYRGVFVKVKK